LAQAPQVACGQVARRPLPWFLTEWVLFRVFIAIDFFVAGSLVAPS